MLKQFEVANLIRRKCGLKPLPDDDKNAAFISKEEQLVMLAHIVKQEELLKEKSLNDQLVVEVTDRVMRGLRVGDEARG